MSIFDLVIWYIISYICVKKINEDIDAEEEWNDMSIPYKLLALTFASFIYIYSEATKK